jgi:hypothetical protein
VAQHSERAAGDLGYVFFNVRVVTSDKSTALYDCSYSRNGKTARFKLELTTDKQIDNSIVPVWSGSGRLISDPKSDASEFLPMLAAALHSKQVPKTTKRVSELSFQMVKLADQASWDVAGGGLRNKPGGDWLGYKLFLGDEAEVFVDVNPITGRAAFLMKDEEDGDGVLRELAKVL